MTRLRTAMDALADQAPPLGDIAERALLRAHRRRRTAIPIGVAASAAAIVLLASLLPGEARPTTSITETSAWRGAEVRFPDRVSEALPAEGAGTALLAYRTLCEDNVAGTSECAEWRVMTTDGRHWRLPDAARFEATERGLLARRSLVTVAPDGRRIGYFRRDGSFVLRDLESGETAELFRWERDDGFSFAKAEWSADGQRLVVSPGEDPFGGEMPPAVLVDVDTSSTTALPGPCCSFGVTDGDRPFPFGSGNGGSGDVPLISDDGEAVDAIDGDLLPGQDVDGVLGQVSPQGDTFAAITFPSEPYVAPRVLVVDLTGERDVRTHQIRRPWETWDSPQFVGWLDDHTVAIQVDHLEERSENVMQLKSLNVDTFDTRTRELQRILRFPQPPAQVSIAYTLLR